MHSVESELFHLLASFVADTYRTHACMDLNIYLSPTVERVSFTCFFILFVFADLGRV